MGNRNVRQTQRGYVTVLIAVLFGMAFTATVLGSAAYIRSNQAVTLASHAQVQAQLKAWTGVEIVRQYLASLESTGALTTLAATVAATPNLALTINGTTGIAPVLVSVDSASNPTQFTAKITGTTATGTRAASTATIQAVYSVSGGGGASTIPALNFNRNLQLGGAITITPANASTQYSINVLGDVSTTGNSITGVSTINATGSINIGSGSAFLQLNSNCDVSITGSVSAVSINAQRNICETGAAASSSLALANGSVSSQSAETANGTISALVHPTPAASCSAEGANQNGTSAATCPVPSVNGVDLSSGAAGAATVNTEGNVVLGAGTINKLYAMGNLSVVNNGKVANLVPGGGTAIVGGIVTPHSLLANGVQNTPGYTVNITAATPVSLKTAQFTATTLENEANYDFKLDQYNNLTVTVSDVNGIPNGTYYVGYYVSAYQTYENYLCSNIANPTTVKGLPWSQPACTVPATKASAYQICNAGVSSSCFSVNITGGITTFTINGTGTGISMPPGIVYINGSLQLGTGTFFDTFIATYNITTYNSDTDYAPNFAGTNGTNAGVTYAPTGICTNSYFPTYYPLEFCSSATAPFNTTAAAGIGNYALLAGSTGTPTYNGGNILVGASNYIYGDIKAGNEFQSGGNSNIAGIVTALAQGAAAENNMGGSTTFNFSKIPPTEDISGGATSNETTTSGTGTVTVEWTKYL